MQSRNKVHGSLRFGVKKFLLLLLISTSGIAESRLKNRINQFVENLKIPTSCHVAISAAVLNSNGDIQEDAHYNQNKLLYSASISKLLILLAILHEVDIGKIDLDQPVLIYNPNEGLSRDITVRYSLTKMISESSNYYAGVAQRLLHNDGNHGKRRTAEIISQYGFGKGIFWVGKGYENGGSYPGNSYNHEATSMAILDFYLQLAQGKFPQQQEMYSLLANSKISNRFYSEIKKSIPLDSIFRKSGSWTGLGVYSDSVMVQHEQINFILVMLIQGKNCTTTNHYKSWHSKLAKTMIDYYDLNRYDTEDPRK